MTNELTNERLREIADYAGGGWGWGELKAMAAELLAKRQEVEALTKDRDSQAREAAGYQKIAKELVDAKEPGLLVLLVDQQGNEVRIFGPDRNAEERFGETVARWWKLLQATSEGLELEDRTKERDAARAENARLASSLAAVERQRDELLEAAKLAIREICPSTDCSMCHDSTWDHECDSKVNTTHVALSNAIKGAIAAEHPKPAGGGA